MSLIPILARIVSQCSHDPQYSEQSVFQIFQAWVGKRALYSTRRRLDGRCRHTIVDYQLNYFIYLKFNIYNVIANRTDFQA